MATLLTNLRLWDGLAERALDGAAVLVEGDRIAWAGPAADVPVRAAAVETVDGRGGTLLPGLIDAHIHFGAPAGTDPPRQARNAEPGTQADSAPPASDAALRAPRSALVEAVLANAAAALDIGITAARDLGAPNHSVIAASREIAGGRARGPHIVAAGRFIALPRGYAPGLAVEVSDPAGVRTAVAEQVAAGAGVIKVIASPVPPVYDPAFPRSFGLENLAAAVEAAHAAGLRLTAHAHSLPGARDAVLAGFDCIEHGYRLDGDTIAEMARRGVWLVPTLVAMEAAQTLPHAERRARNTEPERHGVPRSAFRDPRSQERWEAAADAARHAHRAGVRLATGTDAIAITPVDAIRREVVLLVDAAGLTPVEALRAATSAAAELLGLAPETGIITPGRRADLLLVDGDPLADPAVLARVRAVWRSGVRARPIA